MESSKGLNTNVKETLLIEFKHLQKFCQSGEYILLNLTI